MSRSIPVLFKPYMSRALLDGVKTETRRVGNFHQYEKGDILWVKETWRTDKILDKFKPTEIWKKGVNSSVFHYEAGGNMTIDHDGIRNYNQGLPECKGKTRVSIHLPMVASRQTIVIEEARQEPLLEIQHSGAIAEGIREIAPRDRDGRGHWGVVGLDGIDEPTPRDAYFKLWDLIAGEGEAAKNPKVHVYRFTHFAVNIEDVR